MFLTTFSCSNNEDDTSNTDCNSFILNNDLDIHTTSVIDIPVDTFVFSVDVETPNVGQFVEVEILEQSPVNSIKVQGGTVFGSVDSNNITINFVAATSSVFNVNTGITGKIKVTITETNCSKTIDFKITNIDPDDITRV